MDNFWLLICVAFFAFFVISRLAHKSADEELEKRRKELEKSFEEKSNAIEGLKAAIIIENEAEQKRIAEERSKLRKDQQSFNLILGECTQSRPDLAAAIADAQYYLDMGVVRTLLQKKRSAAKAAEEIRHIAAEKRGLLQQNKSLQYQLDFYEKMFPWLEEFKEVPVEEAIALSLDAQGEEYDAVKNWLSPEEYEKLKVADKFQLALDRWKQRKKSSWEIGIDFERCVGYQLEEKGYIVKYLGAMLGLEDMGRDLLATKDGVTLVIQCKRWAKEKTIHEKHICQLYGSVAVLATQNPEKKYKGVFITTTTLSDTAKMFAEYSGIAYVENCETPDYPMIKCNVSKNGDRIYHLPFDQQYDRTIISKKDGDFYAWTTREAEKAGFRRAFRWHPESRT